MRGQININDEIAIDGFCGGGGWSTGMELAMGRPVDIGINHDAAAIALHKANHPYTKHYNESIYDVNPYEACAGRPVGWAHFSPDCKHFSRAKGGKPVEKKIRGLAWVVLKWAGTVHPRIISMENVVEFTTWGPLCANRDKTTGRVIKQDGTIAEKGEYVPCSNQQLIPNRKKSGKTFKQFAKALRQIGYVVEWKELKACDFGAPTTRKRFFLIARLDGKPIVWPQPTHGNPKNEDVQNGKLLPWRTAAEIINWQEHCPSIFDRKKPLAENTLKRIAKGLQKFVIENPEPFIVTVNHQGENFRGQSINEPLATVTMSNSFSVVTPIIASIGQTSSEGRANSINEPLRTIVSKAEHCVVTPMITKFSQHGIGQDARQPIDTVMPGAARFGVVAPTLIQYHTEQKDSEHRGQGLHTPLQTVDASNRYGLAAATLVQTGYGERQGQKPRALDVNKPLGTVVSGGKHAAVTAFLSKYYGGNYEGAGSSADKPVDTITAVDHNSLVTANIVRLNNNCIEQDVKEPLRTITTSGAHYADVRALLIKFYGGADSQHQELTSPLHTITTHDRFGLVTIHGTDYQIVDIGLRMLSPRELYVAQGFPSDYLIEFDYYGKPYSKKEQVARCGNSVPPPFATALVKANAPEWCEGKQITTMRDFMSYAVGKK